MTSHRTPDTHWLAVPAEELEGALAADAVRLAPTFSDAVRWAVHISLEEFDRPRDLILVKVRYAGALTPPGYWRFSFVGIPSATTVRPIPASDLIAAHPMTRDLARRFAKSGWVEEPSDDVAACPDEPALVRRASGPACFRAGGVPVDAVFARLAEGGTLDDVIKRFPSLPPAALKQVLAQACDLVSAAAPPAP